MKKIILIVFLTLLGFLNPLFSQTKTPYQNRVDEIMTEFFYAIGVKESLIMIAKENSNWDIVRNSRDFAYKSNLLEQEELLTLAIALDIALKDAKTLKTKKDFEREQEIKDNISLQEEIKYRNKLRRYSDFSKIKSEIKSTFIEWIEKDEFETTSDYQKRIVDKGKILDSIAFHSIQNRITTIYESDFKQENCPQYIELIKYNADKQKYLINLVSRAYNQVSYGSPTFQTGFLDKFTDTLNVQMEVAKQLKEKSQSHRAYSSSSTAWPDLEINVIYMCNSDIIASKNLQDWMITPNGYFLPIEYNLFNLHTHINSSYFIYLNKMTIKASEFGLEEYFDNDYIIDIEKVWLKRQS